MRRIPQARIDLEVVDFGSELFLYDRRNDAVHVLNATARQILQFCDGEHDTEQIAGEIGRQFPGVEAGQILHDVESALVDLAGKGVVVWAANEADAAGHTGSAAAGS